MTREDGLPDDPRPGRSIARYMLMALLVAAMVAVAVAAGWAWLG